MHVADWLLAKACCTCTFGIHARLARPSFSHPAGHTLRLLQFPSTLEKGLAKLISLKESFGGVASQVRKWEFRG